MSDYNQMRAMVELGAIGEDQEQSWFQAMAEAWGEALDAQALRIETLSAEVGAGQENPAQLNELTAEALRMGYISNSSHTALTAVGSALESLARKQ